MARRLGGWTAFERCHSEAAQQPKRPELESDAGPLAALGVTTPSTLDPRAYGAQGVPAPALGAQDIQDSWTSRLPGAAGTPHRRREEEVGEMAQCWKCGGQMPPYAVRCGWCGRSTTVSAFLQVTSIAVVIVGALVVAGVVPMSRITRYIPGLRTEAGPVVVAADASPLPDQSPPADVSPSVPGSPASSRRGAESRSRAANDRTRSESGIVAGPATQALTARVACDAEDRGRIAGGTVGVSHAARGAGAGSRGVGEGVGAACSRLEHVIARPAGSTQSGRAEIDPRFHD